MFIDCYKITAYNEVYYDTTNLFNAFNDTSFILLLNMFEVKSTVELSGAVTRNVPKFLFMLAFSM